MKRTIHHKFLHYVAKPLCRKIIFKRNHFTSKIYKLEKSDYPYLILANHQTTNDPVLLICAIKGIMYPVTSKDFILEKYRKIVYKFAGPILKSKNLKDIKAIKETIATLNQGYNVLLYPEGNRTYSGNLCYISTSTAKLLKRIKANIVFYNFHGGYGVEPRYSKDKRKGKFSGEIRYIAKYEDIKDMDVESLKKLVLDNLTVQEAPTPNEYLSSSRAEYLERCLYLCPICGSTTSLYSKGNYIKCKSCGLDVEYTSHLTFKTNNPKFTFNVVADWYKSQEDYVRNFDFSNLELLYEDESCILHQLEDYSSSLITKGKLIMTTTYYQIGDNIYYFKDIKDVTVSGKQGLIFYIGSKTYKVTSSIPGWNAVKYMQMFYHIVDTNLNISDEFLGI